MSTAIAEPGARAVVTELDRTLQDELVALQRAATRVQRLQHDVRARRSAQLIDEPLLDRMRAIRQQCTMLTGDASAIGVRLSTTAEGLEALGQRSAT